MRIDAHHHFWKPERGDYFWMAGAPDILKRTYGPQELVNALVGTGIEKTVLIQAAPTEAETHFLLEQASVMPKVGAVIGWVDMAAASATERLEALFENPLFRGIRPMLQDIEDTGWILNPQLDMGLRTLADKKGVFDALGLVRHLDVLDIFAARHSDLPIVLDHMLKPDIAHGGLSDWASGFKALARHENVTCKLSGLLTEAGPGADVANLQPYFDVALQAFGPKRLMFGSDWPVLLASGRSYEEWLNMADQLMAGLSASERSDIQGGTAARIYRITVD